MRYGRTLILNINSWVSNTHICQVRMVFRGNFHPAYYFTRPVFLAIAQLCIKNVTQIRLFLRTGYVHVRSRVQRDIRSFIKKSVRNIFGINCWIVRFSVSGTLCLKNFPYHLESGQFIYFRAHQTRPIAEEHLGVLHQRDFESRWLMSVIFVMEPYREEDVGRTKSSLLIYFCSFRIGMG